MVSAAFAAVRNRFAVVEQDHDDARRRVAVNARTAGPNVPFRRCPKRMTGSGMWSRGKAKLKRMERANSLFREGAVN
jgi:hypothetical protein